MFYFNRVFFFFFTYLGQIVMEDTQCEIEIRISLTKRAFSYKAKQSYSGRIYSLRKHSSFVLYGFGIWTMEKYVKTFRIGVIKNMARTSWI